MYKKVIENIKYMYGIPSQPMQKSRKKHFAIFLSIFFKGGGFNIANSVILKEKFDVNIGQDTYSQLRNNQIYCTKTQCGCFTCVKLKILCKI